MDVDALWDHADPEGSEARLRAAAAAAPEPDASVLQTQVARALGRQERWVEADELLDTVLATGVTGAAGGAEVGVRVLLERGRLRRSAGDADDAVPLFTEAAAAAAAAGLEALQVDALHMAALVAPPADRLRLHHEALAVARSALEPAARDWDATLLHNIGMTHADDEDWGAALTAFADAVVARERIGDAGRLRVARWMVGWALRGAGRTEEALVAQRALKAELEAAGASDPYVDEEIALLEDAEAVRR